MTLGEIQVLARLLYIAGTSSDLLDLLPSPVL